MTKHNPDNLKPVGLPDFESVDQLFPDWLSARQDLPALIPDQLAYKIARSADSRALVIDYEWLIDARGLAPTAEDKRTMGLRILLIGDAISSINTPSVHLADLTDVAMELALEAANKELVADEQERRKMDMATRRDIIDHILGLEPASGTLADKILRRGRG